MILNQITEGSVKNFVIKPLKICQTGYPSRDSNGYPTACGG